MDVGVERYLCGGLSHWLWLDTLVDMGGVLRRLFSMITARQARGGGTEPGSVKFGVRSVGNMGVGYNQHWACDGVGLAASASKGSGGAKRDSRCRLSFKVADVMQAAKALECQATDVGTLPVF